MGLKPYYLGDTSALARLPHPAVAPRLAPLLESGLVARCTPTDLESGYSSPNPTAHRAMRQFRAARPLVTMDQPVLDRAVEVQDALADRGQQRGAKIADTAGLRRSTAPTIEPAIRLSPAERQAAPQAVVHEY